MRDKTEYWIGALAVIFLATLLLAETAGKAHASTSRKQTGKAPKIGEIVSPFDGALKYPFSKNDSIKSGHWKEKSQDYPYFGAPRDGNGRKHAAIDLYPVTGAGTPIKAVQDGIVIKVGEFYKRHNGEMTYAMLIDHHAYVANYAELTKPELVTGEVVKKEQIIGYLSGTEQLHFGLYKPKMAKWSKWFGKKIPKGLLNPTNMMKQVFKE